MIRTVLKNLAAFMLLALISSFSLIAQNSTPVYFKSGTIALTADAEKSKINFESAKISSEKDNYRIIQFSEIPSDEMRASLFEAGIELLKYLPKNAYFAKIRSNANWNSIENVNFSHIEVIESNYKLSKDLFNKKFNNWAVTANNEIRLNAVFFNGVSVATVSSKLSAVGAKNIIINASKIANFTISLNQLEALYSIPFLYYFEQIDPPSEPENLVESTNHRGNTIATSYTNGLKLDGTGVTVMLQDNSRLDEHIDYTGRFINTANAANNGDHGEHCGGTIAGAGNLDPTTRGMAFGAEVLVYNAGDNNYAAVPDLVQNNNLTITSKSYGGGLNAGYNLLASSLDEQTRNFPELIHVFSAGNSNNSGFTAAGGQWFNITGGHKSAKNVLAVGNVTRTDAIANSSSRGPSEDGRIKPDICAVGTDVNSTVDPNNYDVKTGTSMACPGVAGTLAQLYQGYKELHSGQNPDAALMKGTILNTADDLGNIGPDYTFGWGRINARRAYEVIANNQYFTDDISQGGNISHNITVPAGTAQLKVMVYWSDFEAAPNANSALVNDINMVINDPTGATNLPWLLNNTANAAFLSAPATNAVDDVNNVEQIVIDNPTNGTYTVNIDGFSIPLGPQKYFVTYELITDDVVLTYPIGGESFDPTKSEIIRWDAHGNSGTFSVEHSPDNGVTWNTISNNLPGNSRLIGWNVPSITSGQSLIRVSRNASTSQSHEVFSIIGVPTGLNVTSVCPDSVELSWNNVADATGYEVSMLGNLYMDSVGVSSTNSITVANSYLNDFWWSVKALGANNAVGRRAIAQYQSIGIFNCSLTTDVNLYDQQSLNGRNIQSCMQEGALEIGITIINSGSSPISNIPVSYQFNSSPAINETYAGTIQPLDSFYYSFNNQVSIPFGNNDLVIWTNFAGDQNSLNNEINSSFIYTDAAAVGLPFFEDFESFSLCNTTSNCEAEVCALGNNFVNSTNLAGDDIDWRTNSGQTPSGSTGPSEDFNPGTSNGKYLYLEASATPTCANKEAYLVSPCIDLGAGGILEYAYHMLGSNMGELHVDIFVNGNWINDIIPPVIGNRGNFWRTEEINLNPYAGNIINIRFRGITGPDFRSDLAIDDISITSTLSVSESVRSNFKIYPNPSNGLLFYETDGKEISSISVVDVNGKVVYNEQAIDGNGTINLSHVSKGFYFVKILSAEQSLVEKILID